MTKQEYLANLQVGDVVKRGMHGAGFITDGEDAEIVHINESTIWVDESMEEASDYKRDSVYAYDRRTGKQTESTFGFFKTIELPDWEAPDQ
ncbi:hypothetical protein pEaSNUABM49_00179 [Erwinia phage pEa_SNUABM_49]|nr:hypothetical protein pEaSNUABM49_00179 [Erwinia phage pEa_SNUABM_49]